VLLKLGEHEAALGCFAHVAELGLEDDLEIGLAVGRALYREGLFAEARRRFTSLALAHPASAEIVAARGYTRHALGDDSGARRDLRRALRLDPELHEARIYLAHLLYDRGDLAAALEELERVPPAEHWDPLSLWRFLELKRNVVGCPEDHPSLDPWRARLKELEREPDEIDHLLAEVEAAFEADEEPAPALEPRGGGARTETCTHRIRTPAGEVFSGSWFDIVKCMRDAASGPPESVEAFMRRSALQVRASTGSELPCDSAEAFVRASARIGLLRIEA
jgi:tetratricopeptide (TPR) repeat protein